VALEHNVRKCRNNQPNEGGRQQKRPREDGNSTKKPEENENEKEQAEKEKQKPKQYKTKLLRVGVYFHRFCCQNNRLGVWVQCAVPMSSV
jgi:hypothetical protein